MYLLQIVDNQKSPKTECSHKKFEANRKTFHIHYLMAVCFMAYLIIYHIIVFISNAAGFTYPPSMPPPIDAQNAIFGWIEPPLKAYETPIILRVTSILDNAFWNCIAIYHPTALNSLTKQRPNVIVDSDIIQQYGTSQTRMLCAVYAVVIVGNYILPEAKPSSIELITNTYGLDPQYIELNEDVINCTNTQCLQDIASTNGFYPEIMASIVAKECIEYLENDGWNQDGSIGIDGKECTANCEPYSDTTEYSPNYYDPKRWVPLRESNGKGFFYEYDHVVPHIGKRAAVKTISRQDLKDNEASDPKYDYQMEIQLVIERLAELATNDTQKILVEFFDDKLVAVTAIIVAFDVLLGWEWEERQLYLLGLTSTEYDAVIQAWREKRRWDLVRPTTLIKRRGKRKIVTYGGPYQGLKTIRSRDFESYIRVMPHSEYPSGSGCLCLAAVEYSRQLLQDRYNYNDIEIPLPFVGGNFPAGTSSIEPGVTPSNDLNITMRNLQQFADVCGESRLWGGMHFTAAVSGSYELCEGIGNKTYQYVIDLLDGQPL